MRTRDVDKCLICLERIDFHSSRVDGEIAYIRECFNQIKQSNTKKGLAIRLRLYSQKTTETKK